MLSVMVLISTLLADFAQAQDVKVLEDSAPTEAPGVVRFLSKSGEPLQIALVSATDTSVAGNMMVVEKLYNSLCTTPCTIELKPGWYEFRVAHEAIEWYRKLEVTSGPQTYTIKRFRPGLAMTGVVLTSLIATAPIGVPMMIVGMPGKPKREESIAGR